MGLYPEGDHVYIVIREKGGSVLAYDVDLTTRKVNPPLIFKEHKDRNDMPIGAGLFSNILFVVYKNMVHTIHVESGVRDSLALPSQSWISGRYFRNGDEILALAFNGASISFEYVRSIPDVVDVIECPGREGPAFLLVNGQVIWFEGAGKSSEKKLTLVSAFRGHNPGLRISYVSHAGATLITKSNLGTYKSSPLPPGGAWSIISDADVEITRFGKLSLDSRRGQFRNKFVKVAITADGEIILVSGKGEAVRIRTFGAIRMMDNGPMPLPQDFAVFTAWPEVSRSYDLKIARMSSANVFLDSRGMLHIVPKDTAIPQVTFVLCHGTTAAWTSSGVILGPDAFRPGAANGKLDDLVQLLKKIGEDAL
jgi:hypothetical protein